jgi:hypothetical protein
MKKLYSLFTLGLFLINAIDLIAQPTAMFMAPPNTNGTTQNRAPNGLSSHSFLRAAELVKMTELTYIPANTTLTSIGFTTTAGAGATVPGTITIYAMNTSDATFNLGTSWSSITSSMTVIYSGPYTVPNSATTIDMNLTTPFTYTGGGLYVAWDFQSTGPFSTTSAATYLANHLGLANGCVSANSATAAPVNLNPSNFRPCLRFGFPNTYTNEISVESINTPASLPLTLGAHQAQAVVRNNSIGTVNNVTVNLNITGMNSFTDSQVLPSIAAGATSTVTFANWTPLSMGNNTLAVSMPSDDYNANNALSKKQLVTCNNMGAADPTLTYTYSVGFNTSSGIISARFYNPTTSTVTAGRMVVPTSTANPGNSVYMVLMDNVGTILATTNTLTLNSSMYGTFQTYTFSPPVVIGAGDYYIGLAQPASTPGYFPFGSLQTVFIPSGLFYTSSIAGGSLNLLTQNVGMLFFEAIFAGSCGPTGIENPTAHEAFLSVYPNPATDKIIVKLGSVSEKAYAEIYNSVGQLVKTAVPVMGTEAELNISDLAKGIYIVRVVNGNEIHNVKIAVEK